jgi:hypothetical protein
VQFICLNEQKLEQMEPLGWMASHSSDAAPLLLVSVVFLNQTARSKPHHRKEELARQRCRQRLQETVPI